MATTKQPTKAELAAEVKRLRKDNEHLHAELGGRHHRWLKTTLITVGVVALCLANVALWADRIVLNDDRYTAAVAPLAKNADVQAALQQYAFDELTNRVDFVQVTKDVLPERADILAVPIAAQLKNYANQAIGKVVRSDQFATLWENTARRSHSQFIAAVKANGTKTSLDMSDLYTYISGQLQGTSLQFVANRTLPAGIGQIQVLDTTALKAVHNGIAALGISLFALIAIAIGSFAGAILMSSRKLFTTRWIGIGVVIGVIVTTIAFWIGRWYALLSVHDEVYHKAGVAVWNSLTSGLSQQSLVLGIVGALVAVGAWFIEFRRRATS